MALEGDVIAQCPLCGHQEGLDMTIPNVGPAYRIHECGQYSPTFPHPNSGCGLRYVVRAEYHPQAIMLRIDGESPQWNVKQRDQS